MLKNAEKRLFLDILFGVNVIGGLSELSKKMKGTRLLKMLELYPPFFFMGVKIKRVSKDYRELDALLPLRWFGKNGHGTMFGGFMCSLSDPLAALMCGRIFPGNEVWTKANCVEFLRPGRSDLLLSIRITDEDVAKIGESLEAAGKASHVFEFSFRDREGTEVARVRNTVHVRRRADRHAGKQSRDR